jgi:hypothetical protein
MKRHRSSQKAFLDQQEGRLQEILFTELSDTEPDEPLLETLMLRSHPMGRVQGQGPCLGGVNAVGGDVDDDWYQAEVVGDEAVGGGTPTPDQNVTEDLLHSVGLDSVEGRPIRTLDTLQQRDNHRWELDPSSSEDYPEHSL